MSYQMNSKKCLNDDEFRRLSESMEVFMRLKPDKYLPILLAMHTGCRRSELLKLRVDSFDFDRGSVLISATKGSNDREIYLWDEVLNEVRSYIQRGHLELGEVLFKTSGRQLYRDWTYIRPINKNFHSLRHTFAVNSYKNTKDIHLVMIALGHRDIKNTMIYMNYVRSESDMRRLLPKRDLLPSKELKTSQNENLEVSEAS